MAIELDFVKQLTSTTTIVKNEESYINKKAIKEKYKLLTNSPFLFSKNRKTYEKLEDYIKLTFSYLCLLKILEDCSDDYDSNKEEIRDKARQIFESAESYKEVLREKNKSKCEYINPYQNLLLGNSSNKVDIIRGYERQIKVIYKILELEIPKKDIDPKQIIETYSTFLLQKMSFEILMDPIQKRKIDEEILLNFNPNQEKLYVKEGINDLSYIEDSNENVYKMTNKFNDIIMFQKIGTLAYGFSFKDTYTLQNYKIKKIYVSLAHENEEPKEKEFNVFTCLDISHLTSDTDFTALHADILFSDLNLEEAMKHNAGYIGEIVKNNNGKFDIYHYQDKLCACKEYKKLLKI